MHIDIVYVFQPLTLIYAQVELIICNTFDRFLISINHYELTVFHHWAPPKLIFFYIKDSDP